MGRSAIDRNPTEKYSTICFLMALCFRFSFTVGCVLSWGTVIGDSGGAPAIEVGAQPGFRQ